MSRAQERHHHKASSSIAKGSPMSKLHGLAALGFAWVLLAPLQAEDGPAPRVVAPATTRMEAGPTPRVVSTSNDAVEQLARQIDQHFDRFWKENDITPATLADDAEFLRRLSLDLMGRIPSAAEARAFLANTDPNKRAKAVDEMLARPGYLNHFSTVLRQTWLPQSLDNPQFQFTGTQFETWLKNRLRDNVGMDRMVREIVTAPTLFNQRNGGVSVNPNDTPFVFNQVNEFKPENVVASVSRLFMGVKIECAQCHNHPFASYTKEQFWESAAFFADVQPAVANLRDAKAKREIKIPETTKVVAAKFFDGQAPQWKDDKSPRETFADWLLARDNAYFAKNMANRMWAHFMGLGLTEPIDEPSDENPPLIPELVTQLANAYADAKYDPKFLIRAITRSQVYQRTSKQTHPSQSDPKHFARMNVKAMSGEQLFDSLALATGYIETTPAQQRAFANGLRRDVMSKFASTEKATERQTSILQALTLMNGQFLNDQTSPDRSQLLAAVIDMPAWDTNAKVDILFLSALSRKPTPTERDKFASYIDRGGVSGDKKKATADVFWALLNSSEFMLNH
jgi:hypothetical protein